MASRIFVLIIVLLASMKNSVAQHRMLHHYDVKDGLTSNHIYEAIQDQKGFIWFATDNGVSRFDGIEFKNFTSKDGLPDNDIANITEDATGRIWLSCYNEVPCFIQDNKVHTPLNEIKLRLYSNDGYIRSCHVGNKLLLTDYNGKKAGIEINEKGAFKTINLYGPLLCTGQNVLTLHTIYLGYFKLYDSNYHLVDSLRFLNNISGISQSPVTAVSIWQKNKIAIFFKKNICHRYEVVNNRIHLLDSFKVAFPITRIYTFDDHLWAQINNYAIIPVDEQFQLDKSRETLFRGKLIQNFMQDREGNYWGATAGGGVYMTLNKNVLVYSQEEGLLSNNIQKIYSYKNELHIGYNNSSIQILKGGKIINLTNNIGPPIQGKMTCLYVNDRYVLYSLLDKRIVLSRQAGKINKSSILSAVSLKYVKESRSGALFLGTSSKCYKVILPDKIIDTIPCGRSTSILERPNGDLIVGTLHGLLVCRKQDGKWIIDTLKTGISLKDISVTCIEKLDDLLIVGTVQKGVLILKGNEYEFVQNNGKLKDINCKNINIDKDKNIWVASFSGLHKITPGKDIHHYTIEDVGKSIGLPNRDINDFKLINDTAYVATSQRLLVFPVHNTALINAVAPSVYINELSVHDSIVHHRPEEVIKFSADVSNIEFHFSGIDFKSQGNILFKYRLAGLRDIWQYTDKNSISYEALPSGDYRFEVFAMNDQNVWSASPASIQFSIAPHWWEHKLFLLLFILLSFSVVFFIIRWFLLRKHNQQMKEASIKRHIAEIELKAIKAQVNPHFIFNTLNAIQYFVSNNQAEKAEDYLGKLGSLLRKTLDFSSKTLINLDDEIGYIEKYLQLEKLRFDDSFNFTIHNHFPVGRGNIQVPPMVLQPHIENALRHAYKGMQGQRKILQVRFSPEKDTLVCEIEDNGIGIKSSILQKQEINPVHQSKGIELSHSKLAMYEQLTGKKVSTEMIDLYRDNLASGTLIRIKLKL
jgi:signal transduction histidine kinase